ncbi:shikimate dehydrogenase family protein [Marinomonas ostreistagni]|uniref:Shikimate dehydrogenase n=1 Tax=Marinomonas ostreistagni TaxID=359209 RepID=A0ABS0Z9B9_9GAMM|nr:shikimate dehydrogenase [Marinomonas ostreistagni]MBJ7549591.1 shikimate dehydrogenase [Marinomonas ostreistagni]
MQYIGLIGQSISASRSPSLHNMLGELKQLPVNYELQELDSSAVEAFTERLSLIREKGFIGTNVTFPFKQIAVDSADEVDESVKKVGATNTLLLKDAKVCAFNTDYTGFIRGYRTRLADQPAGKVLMIGAGGVGRAVAFGLFEVGASELFISDLNVAGAEALAQSLNDAGYKATVISADEMADVAKNVDGLVNCTPVGHYKTPGNPLAASAFGAQKWAFDAVYTPLDTEFLKAASAAGLTIVSGFDLFFYQALDAFEIFTGVQVDDVTPVWNQFREKYDVVSDLI